MADNIHFTDEDNRAFSDWLSGVRYVGAEEPLPNLAEGDPSDDDAEDDGDSDEEDESLESVVYVLRYLQDRLEGIEPGSDDFDAAIEEATASLRQVIALIPDASKRERVEEALALLDDLLMVNWGFDIGAEPIEERPVEMEEWTDDVSKAIALRYPARMDVRDFGRNLTSLVAGGDCIPCQERALSASLAARASDPRWEGIIGMEGVMTGDGRLIEVDSLRWEGLPLPIRLVSKDVGAHDGAEVAGLITHIERRPVKDKPNARAIWAEGVFDTGGDAGHEATRVVGDELVNGVSMDLDDVTFEVRVVPSAQPEETVDENGEKVLGLQPDLPEELDSEGRKTVTKITPSDEITATTDGRIRAATIVSIPAFAEAKIHLVRSLPSENKNVGKVENPLPKVAMSLEVRPGELAAAYRLRRYGVESFQRNSTSPAAREAATERGEALPDGSFPIRNKADLARAIKAFGRAKDKAKVKRWIIKRARELDAVDMLPESWNVKASSGTDSLAVSLIDIPALSAQIQQAMQDAVQPYLEAMEWAMAQYRRRGKRGKNWIEQTGTGHLPKYIREIADALMRRGFTEGHAIATAVNTVKRWARGGSAAKHQKGHVNPDTIAKAALALLEWELKRLQARLTAAITVTLAKGEEAPPEGDGVDDMDNIGAVRDALALLQDFLKEAPEDDPKRGDAEKAISELEEGLAELDKLQDSLTAAGAPIQTFAWNPDQLRWPKMAPYGWGGRWMDMPWKIGMDFLGWWDALDGLNDGNDSKLNEWNRDYVDHPTGIRSQAEEMDHVGTAMGGEEIVDRTERMRSEMMSLRRALSESVDPRHEELVQPVDESIMKLEELLEASPYDWDNLIEFNDPDGNAGSDDDWEKVLDNDFEDDVPEVAEGSDGGAGPVSPVDIFKEGPPVKGDWVQIDDSFGEGLTVGRVTNTRKRGDKTQYLVDDALYEPEWMDADSVLQVLDKVQLQDRGWAWDGAGAGFYYSITEPPVDDSVLSDFEVAELVKIARANSQVSNVRDLVPDLSNDPEAMQEIADKWQDFLDRHEAGSGQNTLPDPGIEDPALSALDTLVRSNPEVPEGVQKAGRKLLNAQQAGEDTEQARRDLIMAIRSAKSGKGVSAELRDQLQDIENQLSNPSDEESVRPKPIPGTVDVELPDGLGTLTDGNVVRNPMGEVVGHVTPLPEDKGWIATGPVGDEVVGRSFDGATPEDAAEALRRAQLDESTSEILDSPPEGDDPAAIYERSGNPAGVAAVRALEQIEGGSDDPGLIEEMLDSAVEAGIINQNADGGYDLFESYDAAERALAERILNASGEGSPGNEMLDNPEVEDEWPMAAGTVFDHASRISEALSDVDFDNVDGVIEEARHADEFVFQYGPMLTEVYEGRATPERLQELEEAAELWEQRSIMLQGLGRERVADDREEAEAIDFAGEEALGIANTIRQFLDTYGRPGEDRLPGMADDTEQETGEMTETVLVAGAFPVAPPAEWFADPKLTGPTPVIVTEDGRLYGHLATWDVCHIAHTSQCVTAPRSATGYAYFRTGSVRTREGSEVPVGRVTLDTTHAGPKLNAMAAASHYENTGKAVADVTAGEDQWGIWVAGALRPSVTDEQLRALKSSPLSGDWRRIGVNLELVAALSVNVPGFPIPRPTGLVASGALQSLVASGMLPPRQVKVPGTEGAFSEEDIKYLKLLASRERERDTGVRIEGVELAVNQAVVDSVKAIVDVVTNARTKVQPEPAPEIPDNVVKLATRRKAAELAARVRESRQKVQAYSAEVSSMEEKEK